MRCPRPPEVHIVIKNIIRIINKAGFLTFKYFLINIITHLNFIADKAFHSKENIENIYLGYSFVDVSILHKN